MLVMKNSPALYELLTSGPLAVYKNPNSFPRFPQWSNFSGVTYSMTLRWRVVGCMYWPNVKQSTPTERRSCIVCSICSSVSPNPSIIDDLVTRFGLMRLASERTCRVCRYVARRSRTNGVSFSTVSILWAYTSSPDKAIVETHSMSPRKSGARHSTKIFGFLKLRECVFYL